MSGGNLHLLIRIIEDIIYSIDNISQKNKIKVGYFLLFLTVFFSIWFISNILN